jgi:transcriptional regulator with XRE-family HTH domain
MADDAFGSNPPYGLSEFPREIGIGTVDQKAKIEKFKNIRSAPFRGILKESGSKNMADLAKRLGKTEGFLTNIRNGKRSAGPELIARIKDLVPGVPNIDYLAKDAPYNLVEPISGP